MATTLLDRCSEDSCANYLHKLIRGYTRDVFDRLVVTLGMEDRRTKSGAKKPRTPGKMPILPVETAGLAAVDRYVSLSNDSVNLSLAEKKELQALRRRINKAADAYTMELMDKSFGR